jgi:opacity protein-like surface antigen
VNHFLVLLLALSISFSQDFSFYAGAGVAIHVTGDEIEEGSYFDLIDATQEPALSDFFDPGFMIEYGFSIGIFNSNNKDRRKGHWLVGYNYYMDSMESLDPQTDGILLGSDLEIRTSVPYIGYAFYRGGRYKKGYYYIQVGPAYTTYEGSHKEEGETLITTYRENTGYFLGLGFVSKFSENVALDIGASYIWRDTKPLKTERPTGEDDIVIESAGNLKDNTVKLKIGIMFIF